MAEQFGFAGSECISMLHMIDLFRGTQRAAWGQWWYQQYGVTSEAGLDKPGIGWDFLLYDGRLPAEDYRTILPLHYFSPGNGVFFSRDSWSDTGTSVIFKCYRISETHDDHDQNSIQIYKGGQVPQGGSACIDSFLLGDVISYGNPTGPGQDPNRWDTDYHNTYKMGSANPNQGTPDTIGSWNQRYMLMYQYGLGEAITGDIIRQVGTVNYAYCQGDSHDAYAVNSRSETSDGFNDFKPICSVFKRDMFHLKASSLNLVFMYDHVKMQPNYTVGPATSFWHWPRTYPTLSSPAVYVLDANLVAPPSTVRNRIFNQILLPLSAYNAWNFFDGVPPGHGTADNGFFDTGGAYVNTPLSAGEGEILFSFQPTTTDQTAMTPMNAISSGTMQGVTVLNAAPRYHIVWSTNIDASTPTSIYYDVAKLNQNDKHFVCNLVPGQEYLVSEQSLGGGSYRYGLTVTFNTGFFANSGGILEFTPAEIAGQLVPQQVYLDSISMTDSYTTKQTYRMDIADTMSSQDSMLMETDSILQLDFNDTMSMSDGLAYKQYLSFYDGIGSQDSLAIDKLVTITIPSTTYIEKFINTGSLDLRPRADVGVSIFTPEPFDGVIWDKLADENDSTYIVAAGPNAGQAQIEVRLTNPELYLGAIETFQYVVRARYVDASGTASPYIQGAINGLGLPAFVATSNQKLPLFQSLVAGDYVFDPIYYPIGRSKISQASFVLKVGANVVGGKFLLQVHRVGVRILKFSSTEKVI